MEIPEDIREKTYYHATSTEETGEAILKDGFIRPQPVKSRDFQAPVKGRVYLAPDEETAAIYAMGGVIAPGPEAVRGFSRGDYGYIFEVSGRDFVDIQPDEDSVGDMLYDALNGSHIYTHYRSDPEFQDWLRGYAQIYLTENQLRKAEDGEAIWLSHVGKALLREMPDWRKIDMIRRGANISHLGPLPVRGAYKFDRRVAGPIFTPEHRLFRRAGRDVRVHRHERRVR